LDVVTIGKVNMTGRMLETVLFRPSLVGAAVPPRDLEEDEDEEDSGDEDNDREPAVIREPQED
jgi:hypothetical protein